MRPIAVFYHCLFALNTPDNILEKAISVVEQQMRACELSGLTDAAQHFLVGINGAEESKPFADLLLPGKAIRVYHGLKSHAENLTIVEMEKWVRNHPYWDVLYFHAKGSTRPANDPYTIGIVDPWRDAMMTDVVMGWRNCVGDLQYGYESVGSCFMRGAMGGAQNLWAGNFWWARSEFLATLPPLSQRFRILISGIDSLESRHEAEVWIGNGARIPIVREYRPNGGNGIPNFGYLCRPA